MTYVRRDDPEGIDRVEVSYHDGGFVYFKHQSETSDKTDRLTEAEFEQRYVSEESLRLQESSGGG